MTYSIVAEGLVKQFGTTRALDGINLEVPTGTVFGLLGPNGAGKPGGAELQMLYCTKSSAKYVST